MLVSSRLALFRHFERTVLAHYVSHDVHELDREKLSPLRLKYHNAISYAVLDLGPPEEIRHLLAGFQKYLYQVGA